MRRRLSDYEPADERMMLGDDKYPGSPLPTLSSPKKVKGVARCATDIAEFPWLRAQVCLSRSPGVIAEALAGPQAVSRFVHRVFPELGRLPHEVILVIACDTKLVPLGVAQVAQGTSSSTVTDASTVLRPVLLVGARSFFLVHNHPAGSTTPSAEDVALTQSMVAAAKTVQLKLHDHIIVTHDPEQFYSFYNGGQL